MASMKKLIVLCVLAAAACASDDEVGYPGGRRQPDYPRPQTQRAAAGGLLELMPPDDWWRDPRVQVAVNLTADQMKALDDIGSKQQPEVDKLRTNSREVIRDLRGVLETEHPASADVIAAGERIRKLRDDLFDRELALLDGERQVLTKAQWSKLQDALQERRSEDRGNRSPGGYGRRGRGRFPG